MIRIAHIVNPYYSESGSDWFVEQVTLNTMITAKKFSSDEVDVKLVSAQYAEDVEVVPPQFDQTRNLNRSVLDFGNFKIPKRLPLIKDILDRLYESTEAEWMIYTNIDIGLMPHFYLTVAGIIKRGYDAFILNRRIIPDYYNKLEDIPLMYGEVGTPHAGFDCFIFNRDHYPKYILNEVCIGIPMIGISLRVNLEANANKFKVFKSSHTTFHLGRGTPRGLLLDDLKDYKQHNDRAAALVMSRINILDQKKKSRGVPIRPGKIEDKNIFALIKNNKRVFIETGTYRGGGCAWAVQHFDKVLSIELNPELHEASRKVFKDEPSVSLYLGDSLKVLPTLLEDIDEPCFFWLDAHYQIGSQYKGDYLVPLLGELAIIKNHPIKNHVIVIDDLRLFGKKHWKDVTRESVGKGIREINVSYKVIEYNDTLIGALKEDTWMKSWPAGS